MNLSKKQKYLVGALSAWVILYPFLFFLIVAFSMLLPFSMAQSLNREPSPAFMIPFFAIFPLHCLTILLQLGLSAFYLAHIIKNTGASEVVRIILGVGVFLMPYLAMPVYYYVYIWLQDPPDWAKISQSA